MNGLKHIMPLAIALVFLSALMAVSHAADKAKSLNDIRFEDDMWSEGYKNVGAFEPRFLEKGLEFVIPDPPANDSPETQHELEVLKYYQENLRTPEQLKKIDEEQHFDTELVFGMGEEIPEKLMDEVLDLRYAAVNDSYHYIYGIKRKYKRARPQQLDPSITLVLDTPKNPAYPSGHATISWVGARLFSYLDPKHRVDYMRAAGDVGMRRSISGIHYPGDSVAGRILADQIFDALISVPKFKSKADLLKRRYEEIYGAEAGIKAQEELAALRFGEEAWGEEYLSYLNMAPTYLLPEKDFPVPPPPANDSNETFRELTLLREYARTYRTPEQVALIEQEHGTAGTILTGGPLVEPFENSDVFMEFWPFAIQDLTRFIMKAKHQYDRPRPSQIAPYIDTIVFNPAHASYPSGHAAQSRFLARLLGEIDKAHQDEYLAMADEIAWRREVAGVHYPSDSAAGKKLADEVFAEMMKAPGFLEKLEEVRKDIKGAQG